MSSNLELNLNQSLVSELQKPRLNDFDAKDLLETLPLRSVADRELYTVDLHDQGAFIFYPLL